MSFRKNRTISYASDSPEAAQDASAPESAEPQAQSESAEPQAQAESEQSGDVEVPEGTTAEILQWVGDDKGRAQAALDKEQADDSPRKGLTSELNEILAK